MRDSQFTCPSLFLASKRAFSHSIYNIEQVFIYTLNQSAEAPLLAEAGLSYLGVSHGAEILYVFDEVDLAGSGLEEELLAK
jgi:carboxylesterase type B